MENFSGTCLLLILNPDTFVESLPLVCALLFPFGDRPRRTSGAEEEGATDHPAQMKGRGCKSRHKNGEGQEYQNEMSLRNLACHGDEDLYRGLGVVTEPWQREA
jgi:hypothetical protein